MEVLKMFKWLEKWALKRLLKRIAEGLDVAEEKLAEIWAAHNQEIFEKTVDAIEKTIEGIIKKAIQKK
jgi:hypothetical protein